MTQNDIISENPGFPEPLNYDLVGNGNTYSDTVQPGLWVVGVTCNDAFGLSTSSVQVDFIIDGDPTTIDYFKVGADTYCPTGPGMKV